MARSNLEKCLMDIASHASTAAGFAALLSDQTIPADQSINDAKTIEDRLDRIIKSALKAKAEIKRIRER